MNYDGYLTEAKLGEVLKHIYPKSEIVHNRNLKLNGNLYRPDYYLPKEKLVFEFDGYQHYTNPNRVIRDIHFANDTKEAGLTLISIPFFLQFNSVIICEHLLNTSQVFSNYKTGWIDSINYPSTFCSLGIKRFLELYSTLPKSVQTQLNKNLASLVIQEESLYKVLPIDYPHLESVLSEADKHLIKFIKPY